MTVERETTRLVDLARGRRLHPDAAGWSRTPAHRTHIAGWGRTRRWEYWGIVTDRFVVGLTVAGPDYLANCAVYVLDRDTGEETTRSGIRPLAQAWPGSLALRQHLELGRRKVGGGRLDARDPGRRQVDGRHRVHRERDPGRRPDAHAGRGPGLEL